MRFEPLGSTSLRSSRCALLLVSPKEALTTLVQDYPFWASPEFT